MNSIIINEPNMEDMKINIIESGGLFYQYRPCRRAASTIYDVENIRHNVLYAQTPLNMNDPFDSLIGFSSEKIYGNCIDMIMDAFEIEESIKTILSVILKYQMLGLISDFINSLNDLFSYIREKRKLMHMLSTPYSTFVSSFIKKIYGKAPKQVKMVFSKELFTVFGCILDSFDGDTITEDLLYSVLNLDTVLDEMKNAIVEMQNEKYLPAFKGFLSQLTITCFSASGWDNQLMWAHYADSYSGICVEYDLSKMEEFCGFVYPVNYTNERPTVSLEDLGINIVQENDEVKVTQNEINVVPVFNYLLCKNKCWSYENEWRIINIGEKNTPKFIDFPYIKSITFGLKIDENIKRLIIDICKSKGIVCYELTVNLENFNLDRTMIDFSNPQYDYNEDFEFENIDLIIKHMEIVNEYFEKNSDSFKEKFTIQNFDYKFVKEFLIQLVDFLLDSYNLKISCNRIADNTTEDLSSLKNDEGILGMKKIIEEAVENSKIIYTELDKAFEVIRYSVFIPDGEFLLIRQLIKDVNNMSSQLENIEWKI